MRIGPKKFKRNVRDEDVFVKVEYRPAALVVPCRITTSTTGFAYSVVSDRGQGWVEPGR
jgi:hypothetical protein